MSTGIVVLLAAVAVGIVTGAALQASQFLRGRHVITRKQLALRLVTAALLLLIIAMIFVGMIYPWPVTPEGIMAELGLWSVLTLLAVVVIFLAMADLRQVEREKHVRQAALYRAIQEAQDDSSGEDTG